MTHPEKFKHNQLYFDQLTTFAGGFPWMFGRLQIRHCFSRWERQTAPFIQSQKTRNYLQKKKTMRKKVFDARPDARRSGIRRGFIHSRLLFVRRSDGRSRIPHDGLSRSIGEALGGAEQNDIVPSRTRLQPEQDAVGRGLRLRPSAHSGHVDARSRARARLHKTGDLEDRNGLPRHYRPTAFDIFEERGGSQYIQENKHQQIWNKTK